MPLASDELLIGRLSPLVEISQRSPKCHRKFNFGIHKKQFVGDYQLDRVIGKGRCGYVYIAWHADLGSPVAIKVLPRLQVDEKVVDRLVREIEALNRLDHPHVIRINEIVLDKQSCGLVMDWASGGDVFRHLAEYGAADEARARKWFSQLVWAVDEMHSMSLVHQDIKPENLLIDANDNLILTDFEMCQSFARQGFPYAAAACGSLTYFPPEAMLSAGSYDMCKADVWAMGVTLFALVAGYLPFDDGAFHGDSPQEIAALYRHILEAPLNAPSTLSPALRDLLAHMLCKTPGERFSLSDIKNHVWLAEQTHLWECPQFEESGCRRRGSRFGSLTSTSSLQTLSDKMSDCPKQVRGPIIWDPSASCDLPRR